ncbi:hypothetical protein Hanom_Chr02g00112991 [Helianthus anomalus]
MIKGMYCFWCNILWGQQGQPRNLMVFFWSMLYNDDWMVAWALIFIFMDWQIVLLFMWKYNWASLYWVLN